MPKRGKRYQAALEKFDRQKKYSVEECVALIKEFECAKYDETVEVAFNLGVDPKHADQIVRGAVVLPHGTGKNVRVVVFAKGEKEKEALDAGADFAGSDELIEKIKGGWFEFDVAIAAPNMMAHVGKIGRLLGPRGLMPNPKVGTVTFDVGAAVKLSKAGKISYRTDKAGLIHCAIGKRSFSQEALSENFGALMDVLAKAKPAKVKGTYLHSVTFSTTHGPGVRADANELASRYKA